MRGHFKAIGVGPGDPGLLTVKAVGLLREAQHIYHAGPTDDQGRALEIVRGLLRPEQQVRTLLPGPMAAADEDAYRAGVERLAADVRAGEGVVFITEGDPTLFSTAAAVWELLARLHPDIPLEIVPGVTSITAAAARVGWPLLRREETLRIVPALHYKDRLAEMLEKDSCVCLLKPGPTLSTLVDAVAEQGTGCEAVYVEELGTEKEWLTHNLAEAIGRNQYFSLVLVRRLSAARCPLPACGGKVWLVGLGPGAPALLTRQALHVLHTVSDLIGYEGYLNRLAGLGLGARFHPLPIGAEAERARLALELARQGRQVALASSGDAGIYGMASLLLEAAGDAADVEVEIVPGVTAATAAAACLGAPLGHDFACISLSDLLTPWPLIEQRLDAAGRGDFVIALYNPVSRERTWQLPRARDILLKYRTPATPVGLVTGAYRDGMEVRHTTLGELTTDGVTMETLVLIGSSQTRLIGGRLVTPRAVGSRQKAVGSIPASLPAAFCLLPTTSVLQESFALIERELGPHALPPWAFAVVRRMIHASADFDFARSLRYSADFEQAIRAALQERLPIVTDTEMVREGIRSALARTGVTLSCHLNDPAARTLAETEGLTRSAAGIRLAARHHARAILVFGNAPTALVEALRLTEQEQWRPAVILGMPVGFVGVEEAKQQLQEQTRTPYLCCLGRKGGSAVAAAALNALVEFFGRFA
jgi:precorrin-2 C(20)-methyltransferase